MVSLSRCCCNPPLCVLPWRSTEILDALTAAIGARSLTLRTWARIPAACWETIVKELKIDDAEAEGGQRGPSPIEEGQVGELQLILQKLAAGPSPAISGGGGGAQGEGGRTDPHPAGGTGDAAAAAGAGSGLPPGGTDGPPPARTPTQLALPPPGPSTEIGTGPAHDARHGPAGTRACVGGGKRSRSGTTSRKGRGGCGSEG